MFGGTEPLHEGFCRSCCKPQDPLGADKPGSRPGPNGEGGRQPARGPRAGQSPGRPAGTHCFE